MTSAFSFGYIRCLLVKSQAHFHIVHCSPGAFHMYEKYLFKVTSLWMDYCNRCTNAIWRCQKQIALCYSQTVDVHSSCFLWSLHLFSFHLCSVCVCVCVLYSSSCNMQEDNKRFSLWLLLCVSVSVYFVSTSVCIYSKTLSHSLKMRLQTLNCMKNGMIISTK